MKESPHAHTIGRGRALETALHMVSEAGRQDIHKNLPTLLNLDPIADYGLGESTSGRFQAHGVTSSERSGVSGTKQPQLWVSDLRNPDQPPFCFGCSRLGGEQWAKVASGKSPSTSWAAVSGIIAVYEESESGQLATARNELATEKSRNAEAEARAEAAEKKEADALLRDAATQATLEQLQRQVKQLHRQVEQQPKAAETQLRAALSKKTDQLEHALAYWEEAAADNKAMHDELERIKVKCLQADQAKHAAEKRADTAEAQLQRSENMREQSEQEVKEPRDEMGRVPGEDAMQSLTDEIQDLHELLTMSKNHNDQQKKLVEEKEDMLKEQEARADAAEEALAELRRANHDARVGSVEVQTDSASSEFALSDGEEEVPADGLIATPAAASSQRDSFMKSGATLVDSSVQVFNDGTPSHGTPLRPRRHSYGGILSAIANRSRSGKSETGRSDGSVQRRVLHSPIHFSSSVISPKR